MDLNTLFVIAVTTTKMIFPGMPEMPNMPGMPGMGAPVRTLTMDLTSDKKADKSSKAECAIPEGLKLGPKVPLYIDLPQKGPEVGVSDDYDEDTPTEKPEKFVIKYYWMCGEKIAKGQPKIFDSEKMMAGMNIKPGQMPKMSAGSYMRGGFDDNDSHAYWPKAGETPIKNKDQHCPGLYKLTTNYVGGTEVTLNGSQDFLAPIELTQPKDVDLQKTIQLEWKPVPNAKAYILSAMGFKDGEMVFWTSAADPNITADFANQPMTSDEVIKYIDKGILLPSDKTTCRIPAGIFVGCDSPMLNVTAIGTDTIQKKDSITTHVLVRSTATMMLGEGMGMGMEMDEADTEEMDVEEANENEDADEDVDESEEEDPSLDDIPTEVPEKPSLEDLKKIFKF